VPVQDELPLQQAFIAYAAICTRYDLKPSGPTYVEMEMLKAFDATEPKPKRK